MSQRKTVAFISRKWPPAVGGMETYALRLSQVLSAHVDVTRWVLPGRADGSVPRPARLLRWGVTTGVSLLFARNPADVIHAADMAIWPLALLGALRRPGRRIVLSAHGTDVAYGDRGGWRSGAYRVYLKLGAALMPGACVIANSHATAERVRRLGYRNTHVVPLAADTPCPARRSPGDKLLFSGRLVRRKGLSWFVRSVLSRLPERFELDVAGTFWHDSERSALAHPRVNYLGALNAEALGRAYRSALCVVVPNLEMPGGEYEGFGLVAVEAAGAGGLVLAAREGGLSDAVVDGHTGFLLPSGDPAAWEAKIREIGDWPAARRDSFIGAAVAEVARRYSWTRVARETAKLYEETRGP
ncbi:MAG: glycosyltransferase family 4 protein [Pseudomonadota bacterium]